ncbi:MAG: hypothetical protein KDK50_01035 [Chlamydiia bacterium]|nr:hypothetical protein [Chlamydiia bacterium]
MEKGKFWVWLGGIIISIFVLLFALPTLLSTRPGTKLAASLTHSQIGKMDLSWFGGQQIDDFLHRGNAADIAFKQFSTDSSLLILILTKRSSETKLIAPSVTYRTQKKSKTKPAFFLPFRGGVDIQDGTLTIMQGTSVIAQLSDVSVLMNVSDGSLPVNIKAHGLSSQGTEKGEFQVDAIIDRDSQSSAAAKKISQWIGLPSKSPLKYQLSATFNNLPMSWQSDLDSIFGSALNAKIQGVFSSKENTAQIELASSQLQSTLNIAAPQDAWIILPSSWLNCQLNSTLPHIQSATLKLQSENISIPIDSYELTQGNLSANVTNAQIMHNKALISISSLTAHLGTNKLDKNLKVNLDSTLNAGSSVKGSFVWSKPLMGWPSLYNILTGLELHARNVPTSLLNVEWLGPIVSFDAAPDGDILDIAISSKLINTQALSLKINPTAISLNERALINYTLTDSNLKMPTNLQIAFTELYLPKTWQKMHFKGSVTAPKLQLKSLPYIGELTLNDAGLSVVAKSLKEISFSSSAKAQLKGGVGLLSPNLDLKATGKANAFEQTLPDIKLIAQGASTNLEIDGFVKNNTLIIDQPLELSTILKPQAFTSLLPPDINLKLIKDSKIDLSIAPFSLTLPSLKPTSPLQITVTSPELALENYTVTRFKLKTLNHTIETSGNINQGYFDIMVEKPQNIIEHAEVTLKDFPSAIIDALIKDDEFAYLFGNTVTMDLDYKPDIFALDINSPKLDLKGTLKVKDNNLQNSSALTMRYLLTQNSFAHFLPQQTSKLKQPTSINLNISRFSIPVTPAKKLIPRIDWNLAKATFEGKMQISEMQLEKAGSKISTTLKNFSANLLKAKPTSPLSFKSNGRIEGKNRTGSIDISGNVSDFYNEAGKYDPTNLSANIKAQLETVPTVFVDLILPKTSLVCGDTITAAIDADIVKQNGTLDAAITSPHCKANVAGFVRRGILSLREPLKADIILTPGLSRVLFKDANLIVVSAKTPMHVYIDPKNTAIPLTRFNWQNVRVGFGRFDFGQLIVASKGSAADMVEILKLRSPNQVGLWFAPLDFSIYGGVMQIDRTEILYDMSYQIATWGRISFPKSYVDMTLGLTAQALNRAFGLNVPNDFVLTVDFDGPFGNVKINKAEAISKIALLVGNQSGIVPKKGIAGGIFGVIQSFAQNQSEVPPAKPPFPWQ